MSRRSEQIASMLQRSIQEVIDRGFHDPRISGLITVTGVRLPEDMKTASVTVSVMPADRQELTMHGLRSAAAHIRREVGELVAMRQVPQLHFKLDESLKKQAAVMAAIAKAAAEREAAGKPAPEPAAEPEGENPAGGKGAP